MTKTLEWLRALPPEELLARTLEGEAGGEGPEGMLAAGAVIANRLRNGYGDDWADVILAPGQFSLYNGVTGYADGQGANDVWLREPGEKALAVAQSIVAGDFADPTGGATHYYNPAVASPDWAEGKEYRDIGRHRFLSADGGRITMPANPNIPLQRRAAMQAPQQAAKGRMTPAQEPSTWEKLQRWMVNGRGPGEGSRISPLVAAMLSAGVNLPRAAKGQGVDPTAGADYVEGIEQARTRNRTAAWLEQQGAAQLAEGVRSGAISGREALALMQQSREANKGVVVDKRIVDPITGRVIYEPTGPEAKDQKPELDLMKAYRAEADVAMYRDLRDSYERMQQSYQQVSKGGESASGLGDVALLFSYMKLLDPGSVVREGEFATVANAGGVGAYVMNLYNSLLSGQKLTPTLRKQILNAGERYYGEAVGNLQATNEVYRNFAERYGVTPGFLIEPEVYEGASGGGSEPGASQPGVPGAAGGAPGFDPSLIEMEE